MQAVAAGDQRAVAELYDRHAAAVYGMAMAVVRDAAIAQDVTQEVFVRLWMRAQTFNSQRGTALAWLVSVARNLALDELRRQRRQSERAERLSRDAAQQIEPGADLLVHLGWDSERVLQAVAELSSLQREVVELVYLRGYTLAEASARVGVAVGTIKSRLHSALLSLRAALAEETPAARSTSGR
jgi:RNA polymerase sigma-70 factor, ECF subfamily